DQNTEAAKLAFQTEHTFSYSRSLDGIVTKDGTIIKVGELESEASIEALQAKDDAVRDMLRKAVLKGERLELWEVTVDEELKDTDGKYPAVDWEGYLDSWEDSAGPE